MLEEKRRRGRNVYSLLWVTFVVCLLSWGGSTSLAEQKSGPATEPGPGTQSELSAKAQALLQQGGESLARKEFAAAEAAFREAIEIDPASSEAHRALGFALWEDGHTAAAWKELRLASRLDPNSASVHYALGKLAWVLYQNPVAGGGEAQSLSPDDYRALALREVERAVGLDPHNFKMRLYLAELNLAVGQNKQAEAQAKQAIQLASSASERSHAHVTMARALIATGDEDRGERECEKALEEDSDNGSAYLNFGQLQLLQQRPLEAAKYFRKAIQVSPDLEPAYAALGRLLANAHQHAEARALFEKAVTLDPGDWQSRYRLAVLLMEAGQSARAKAILTTIAAQQADFLPAREQLGLLLLRQGDLKGAQREAQTLIARNPQAVEGHRVMALILWRERKMESSLAECALALAADPHSTSMLALQSIELWQEKRKKDAQAAFRQAAHLDPGVASDATFCRLIACDSQDIPLVHEFLRKNRWVLNPAEPQ